MAKAKKLKSGSWRVQVYSHTDENGKKKYKSFTADTKSGAEYMAALFKAERGQEQDEEPEPERVTVAQAIDRYVELSEVLSPSTLKGYDTIRRSGFRALMGRYVDELDDAAVQAAINLEAKRKTERTGKQVSAKWVRNEWGLVAAALKAVSGKSFNVKLPKKARSIEEFPEPEAVIRAIAGTDVELPCMLAIWLSLTMSEIRGIKCSSIRNGVLYIDLVRIDMGEDIIKSTAKTDTRTRKFEVPEYIMQLIEKTEAWKEYEKGNDGFLIPLSRWQIYSAYKRATGAAGIDLSFHDLRHLNASVMLALNVPTKYAMERGGWKTPHVMQSVYQHTFSSERRKVDATMDEYFENIIKKAPAEPKL